jgi:hypothetical protein
MPAAISGTITEAINESHIVAGGRTIIITLTGDTWVAGGATNFTADANMISYWMMEQATGTDAPDGSSSGNTLGHLSDGGGPTQDADHMQGSYSAQCTVSYYEYFARTDADLSIGFPGKTGTSETSFSIGAWVKFDTNAVQGVISKGSDGSNINFVFGFNGAYMRFQISTNGWGLADDIIGSTSLTVDGSTWYHVVAVHDIANHLVHLYVNGSSDAEPAVKANPMWNSGTSAFYVGRDNYGILNGHLDEVFMMNRVLSAAEVMEIYTHGLAGDR